MTVSLGVGTQGRQGGGQGVGVGGDVVLVVIVRLGRPLRVTAGEEVGAGPRHSGFLFGAGTTHLLPGNQRDTRSAASVAISSCDNRECGVIRFKCIKPERSRNCLGKSK